MIVIWYNPDLDVYEAGNLLKYQQPVSSSTNGYRFEILHTLTSSTLAEKVSSKLNQAKAIRPTSAYK